MKFISQFLIGFATFLHSIFFFATCSGHLSASIALSVALHSGLFSVASTRDGSSSNFICEGVNGFVDVADVVEIMMRLMNSDIAGEKFILVSENYTYHKLFNEMAAVLKKPAPSFKAGKLLRSFAWRMEWLRFAVSQCTLS